jgi:hypothetical protein
LIGLGTKASRANQYDLAVWAFTKGAAVMNDARHGAPHSELDQLRAYALNAACLAQRDAQRDSGYTGPLILTPTRDCEALP